MPLSDLITTPLFCVLRPSSRLIVWNRHPLITKPLYRSPDLFGFLASAHTFLLKLGPSSNSTYNTTIFYP
uniref:Predicted protein n=1 Tax=Hordeum vulgare subsp. vulgare TaxID=112509 RepID=F2DGS5_HORVV|nr:predicted protein [Hordeum vulgare subsp. vulgare]